MARIAPRTVTVVTLGSLIVTLLACAWADPPPSDDHPVSDPCVVRAGEAYWLFSTGSGIPVRVSSDLKTWARRAPVFPRTPKWVCESFPGVSLLWQSEQETLCRNTCSSTTLSR
jgi:hypothetical protein